MTNFLIPADTSFTGRIKTKIRPFYYFAKLRLKRIRIILFAKPVKEIKNIPIIINNFNRLSYTKQLVEYLEQQGYRNIYIIDNASTYPPLLEYYDTCPYPIFRLQKNIGYLALWKTGIYKQFHNSFFVYTDPDVLPVKECPDDFMQKFYDLLIRYPYSSKAGFSLKIDDLPEHFDKKNEVLAWESQYWQYEIEPGVHEGAIDTTFALYRPFTKWGANFYECHLRTDSPYQMRHLPWYTDSGVLSDEDHYYISQARTSTHWTGTTQTITQTETNAL